MLKIKIAAALAVAAITICSAASFSMNRISPETNKSPTAKLKSVSENNQTTVCKVEAYRAGFAGDEPKTSIVRAKPDKNSSILKTVTTKDEIIFYITGSDGNGWFEISKIETTGGDVDQAIFKGRGWIHSSLVDLSVGNADAKLYSAPRKKSRVLKKLIADESEARPLACQGNWMKIKSGKSIGWLSPEGQCANPLTTCS